MHSLRTRLTAGLIMSLALVFCAQWLLVEFSVRQLMESFIAEELVEDTEELLAALEFSHDNSIAPVLKQIDPAFLNPRSGHYYQVLLDGTKAFSSPSLAGADLWTTPIAVQQSVTSRLTWRNGQTLLVGARGFEKDTHRVTIAIAVDLKRVSASINQFLWRYTALSGVILLLLVLIQNWIVRGCLSILGRIRRDIVRLGEGEINELNDRVPTEVSPLVREINELSKRLSQRLKRSREALGNLAHALKAPLTLLTQMANDVQLRPPMQLGAPMLEQLGVLRERIDLELKRARLAGSGGSRQALNLTKEVEPLVHTMQSLYAGKGIEIGYNIPAQASFRGDREDLLELIGNVLDNACKFSRHRVQLTITDVLWLEFAIEDDGPGCPPEAIDTLIKRGVRLDESKAGHGLGLAIAADIVSSYEGEIEFGKSQKLGGFLVSVRFPAQQRQALAR
jgi:signal transduction histidine kinase